jgi:molybdopterin-guanine dinucleotide biosynthesis protein A
MVSAILAGGRNTRYPSTKAFIEVEGTRLVERTLFELRKLGSSVVISTNAPEDFFYLGVPLVGDIVQGKGPMGGLLSLFKATGADEVLIVACDMPFVSGSVLELLADSPQAMATICRRDGRAEPLLAKYNASIVPELLSRIEGDRLSMRRMIEAMDVLYIEEEQWREVDPGGRSFLNINTPDDYKVVIEEA